MPPSVPWSAVLDLDLDLLALVIAIHLPNMRPCEMNILFRERTWSAIASSVEASLANLTNAKPTGLFTGTTSVQKPSYTMRARTRFHERDIYDLPILAVEVSNLVLIPERETIDSDPTHEQSRRIWLRLREICEHGR